MGVGRGGKGQRQARKWARFTFITPSISLFTNFSPNSHISYFKPAPHTLHTTERLTCTSTLRILRVLTCRVFACLA